MVNILFTINCTNIYLKKKKLFMTFDWIESSVDLHIFKNQDASQSIKSDISTKAVQHLISQCESVELMLYGFPSLVSLPRPASHLFSDTFVLTGTVAGNQRLSWDPAPQTGKKNSCDGENASYSMLSQIIHLETRCKLIVYRDFKYLPHHTTAVGRQSVEGIVDVHHILGTPQPLCHSTGTRPGSDQRETRTMSLQSCVVF